MVDGISLVALGPLGAAVAVWAYPVILVLRGQLVPRRALDDERADTAEWREAHRLSEQSRLVQAEQTRLLLAHAETANGLLLAITERGKANP